MYAPTSCRIAASSKRDRIGLEELRLISAIAQSGCTAFGLFVSENFLTWMGFMNIAGSMTSHINLSLLQCLQQVIYLNSGIRSYEMFYRRYQFILLLDTSNEPIFIYALKSEILKSLPQEKLASSAWWWSMSYAYRSMLLCKNFPPYFGIEMVQISFELLSFLSYLPTMYFWNNDRKVLCYAPKELEIGRSCISGTLHSLQQFTNIFHLL